MPYPNSLFLPVIRSAMADRRCRLLNDPRPKLWKAWSDKQIFLTALEAHPP